MFLCRISSNLKILPLEKSTSPNLLVVFFILVSYFLLLSVIDPELMPVFELANKCSWIWTLALSLASSSDLEKGDCTRGGICSHRHLKNFADSQKIGGVFSTTRPPIVSASSSSGAESSTTSSSAPTAGVVTSTASSSSGTESLSTSSTPTVEGGNQSSTSSSAPTVEGESSTTSSFSSGTESSSSSSAPTVEGGSQPWQD